LSLYYVVKFIVALKDGFNAGLISVHLVVEVPQAVKGKSAGRGNVILPRSRRAGAGVRAGTWVQGETEAVSSCAIFAGKKMRGGRFAAPRWMER
jgi:hypothetical protein